MSLFKRKPKIIKGHGFNDYFAHYGKGYMNCKNEVITNKKNLKPNHRYYEIDGSYYQIDHSRWIKNILITLGCASLVTTIYLPIHFLVIAPKERYHDYNFQYWNECESLNKLKTFVRETVTPSNKNYVPQEDRIATFDMDGTLFGERSPIYIEWMMYQDYLDNYFHGYRGHEITYTVQDTNKTRTVSLQTTYEEITDFINGTESPDLEMDEAHCGAYVFANIQVVDYIDYVESLNSIFLGDEELSQEIEEAAIAYEAYTKDDFLTDVYMSEKDLNTIDHLLASKKNIILQGAPGVGKTFAAKRLAYALMEKMDSSRVQMIQFHQSYSYEDFIMGYRPVEDGFKLETGAFYDFCKKASEDEENKYYFIIDEINRGNLSKIFGELFMLIESDKRGQELRLLYKKEMFSVPKNVYIIGLMNTADRSLAMLDYALRRRFAFFIIKPGFDSEGFRDYQDELKFTKFDALIQRIKDLNQAIENDASLGKGFCIGHSYFCNLKPETISDEKLQEIVEYEMIPLLEEYWFDEPEKVKQWSNALLSVVR